jgi:hypothetical protein
MRKTGSSPERDIAKSLAKAVGNSPTVGFESRVRSARQWKACLYFKISPIGWEYPRGDRPVVKCSILLAAAFGKPHEMASDNRLGATRRRRTGSPTPDPVAWLTRDAADHDKNLVAAYVNSLVLKGRADLKMLGNGDVELRLKNGRIFHLGDEGLTRVA